MKLARSVALVASLLTVSVSALGAESGKIYTYGKWLPAEKTPAIRVENQNALLLPNLVSGSDLRASATRFLTDNAVALNLDSKSAWALPTVQKNEKLETLRVAKIWNGLQVLGGEALVHYANGKFLFANADDTSLAHLSSQPRLSAAEARDIAFANYAGSAVSADQPKLAVMVMSNEAGREALLVYEVTVRDRDTFSSEVHYVDALRGSVVKINSNVHTAAPRMVMAAKNTEDDLELDETVWTKIYASDNSGCASGANALAVPAAQTGWLSDWWNGRNAAPAVTNLACGGADERVMNSATLAWKNSGAVDTYYQSVHQRNSIDGRGLLIKSIVNFGGGSFGNAGWYDDKKMMLYGTSNRFNDFALPLDVAGHEITHGVTSSTAKLEYSAESGALNESYSDVFGKLIAFRNGKPNDWKIGRELFRDGTGFIRDMENPEVGHNRDYKFRGEQCHRFNDFCGVHTNSGIPNKAAVLLSKSIGLDKLGKLYYLTLTQLLRSNSSFADAKAQTLAACATLFGSGSADCRAVTDAFTAVGI